MSCVEFGGIDLLTASGRVLDHVGDRPAVVVDVGTGSDVVVANLPYLPRRERSLRADLAAEPEGAVFAPGDGLGLYRRLRTEASPRLAPNGLLALQLRGRIVTPAAARAAISSSE